MLCAGNGLFYRVQLAEKLQYARWKAADISKCLREGRVPMAGSPSDVPPTSAVPVPEAASSDFLHSPQPVFMAGSIAATASAPTPSLHHAESSAASAFDFITPSPPTPIPSSTNGVALPTHHNPISSAIPIALQTSSSSHGTAGAGSAGPRSLSTADLTAHEAKLDRCIQAERMCRHALSSLHYQDVQSAVTKMQDALALLLPLLPPQ